MTKSLFMTVAFLIFCFSGLSSAQAHKVLITAWASGDHIEGRIGFGGGGTIVPTPITIFDPEGRKLGETKTDANGMFVFTPGEAIPHIFKGDLGSGHLAEIRLEVDELPSSLRPQSTGIPRAEQQKTSAFQPDANAPATLPPEIRAIIAETIRNEILPLRRELAAYKEHVDFQSLLGGIGYIVGLFGIGFYFAARRRSRSSS